MCARWTRRRFEKFPARLEIRRGRERVGHKLVDAYAERERRTPRLQCFRGPPQHILRLPSRVDRGGAVPEAARDLRDETVRFIERDLAAQEYEVARPHRMRTEGISRKSLGIERRFFHYFPSFS